MSRLDPAEPDNLFEPVPGDQAAHGPFDANAKDRSLQWQLAKHRTLLGAAGLSALVLAAASRRLNR